MRVDVLIVSQWLLYNNLIMNISLTILNYKIAKSIKICPVKLYIINEKEYCKTL